MIEELAVMNDGPRCGAVYRVTRPRIGFPELSDRPTIKMSFNWHFYHRTDQKTADGKVVYEWERTE